ncbi:MAG: 1-acyl-sn-glycerol-3-phosphate acyltransferase [Lachnospiraceae bacterium]|nr:1-acyl-sn-glycerol-3-phosphate acyltransferase [Lachnospiraceae bacterium]
MIRTIIFITLLIFFCLLFPLVWLVAAVGSLFRRRFYGDCAFYYLKMLMHLAVFVGGCKVVATGVENVPDDETVLYVLNHRSYFDIFIVYTFFREPTGFVAKEELKYLPCIAWYMKMAYCLFLDRKNLRKGYETIQKGIGYLNEGVSMAIFPEGTRNKDHADKTGLLEFHGGSFKLAQRSGVRIIPVTLYNTDAVFEAHVPRLTPVTVKVDFGAPITIGDLPKEDQKHLAEYVKGMMQNTLNDLAEGA